MSNFTQRILNNPKYEKILYWGKLIFVTGGTQASIQAVGLVSGVLIIRLLPVEEYALYTLANTMLGTMTVLADGGISSGVMSQGGKIWQNKKKLSVVLETGWQLRKKFALVSMAISLPILMYLLMLNGSTWQKGILIALALVPAFYAALSDSLLEIVPKLHQDIKPLQINALGVSLGRLILVTSSIFIFPFTFIAILANGLPRMYGNLRLKKITSRFIEPDQKSDQKVRGDILKTVRRMLPEIIYYCLSGQITIWIISLIGTTTALASLGALSRIGVVVNVLNVVFATLIVPRFARMQAKKNRLFKFGLTVFLGVLTSTAVILAGTYIFSAQILLLLGQPYINLKTELLLSVLVSCVYFFQVCYFSLLINKGWIINPYFYMLVNFASTIALCLALDLTSLVGVLELNLFLSLVQALVLMGYFFFRIWRFDYIS